jgi:hypothetical protein
MTTFAPGTPAIARQASIGVRKSKRRGPRWRALEASQSRGLVSRLTGAPARLLNGAQRDVLSMSRNVDKR